MPNLYTSLLARHRGITTLAPKNQLRPVPHKVERLDFDDWNTHIAELHKDYIQTPFGRKPPTRSVAIIGAGLAGLSIGYELRKRGYTVRVLEAGNRPGGRTWTIHNIVKDHLMDGGAELIGSNHPLWLSYAHTFRIGFSKVLEYKRSPIIVGNTELSRKEGERLLLQMDDAFATISARAKTIVDPFMPWADPHANALDRKNVYEFVTRTDWPRICKEAVIQQLESDNGVIARRQSLLALLAMVKGGGAERYWLDTEVYRAKRGTQALSFAFESALRGMNTSISYKTAVLGINASGNTVQLTTQEGKTESFDDVILTIAPSAWSTIQSWQPDILADFVSAPPQMGENVKALLGFHARFWEKQNDGPAATINGPVDQTWETTEGRKSPDFGMVAFSGSNHAAALSRMTDSVVRSSIVASLQRVYKRTSKELAGFRFMNWPKEPWIMASYSFPDCGDVIRWGPKFNEGFQGKLHFAGEHTCYAFTGYMEGALQSGFRLARKMVWRDGGEW